MEPILLLGIPGGPEWIIILIIIVLLFGGKKLPGLMKGLGKGIKDFKDAKNDISNETEDKDEK
ncbi:MAG: twin-arginine translocase TatA/TatE family subunit [Flavobacteriales bacterium]|jgi:sec-independent protein translocase protein TatA|nr:twin-arginine translocase TatA/TatE family subunit [Flavobacteriales bacterium]MBT5698901.1 twin-arginine translocase TatA/TatE family subunit [Flavobacteriales bacterium]MBT7620011.1 twin-arginine translocase TatA/TatE family subunit [Flavobacteriales bacterium]|tara:strand:- start:411 stop:599 length:189 start_codon:yes stop_codon:yes gene_type:complete